MGIHPSSVCISSAVWLHHLDPNKMIRVKARSELHKNAACCSEQILEATPN